MKRIGFAAVLFVFAGAVFGAGSYNGGSGTEGDPYQIATAGQLHELSLHSVDWGKHFLLTSDLDLAGVEMGPIGLDSTNAFVGVFDGGGHVISNLTINMPDSGYVGLFGYLEGEIKNLGLENVSVTGDFYVGGLVGYSVNSTISQCFSRGTVNGNIRVGGLIGCGVSGIARNCYSLASVTGDKIVGGFFGTNYGYPGMEPICCYSAGSVSGNQYVGGFTGLVSGSFQEKEKNFNFWDVDTSSIAKILYEHSGFVGLVTPFMKSSRIYSYCGWSGDVWKIDEGNDYPRLDWENKPGMPLAQSNGFNGSATATDPYRIETAMDLRILTFDNSLWGAGKHFVMTSDLDLEGLFFSPIGRPSLNHNSLYENQMFSGSFDGGGHVISNFKLDLSKYFESYYAGFFNYISEGAEVRNLGLENVDIRGDQLIGGLAGVSLGTVSQCFVTGVVEGDREVGGFVGKYENGFIFDSYCMCSVSGEYRAGGFIGMMDAGNEQGSVERCYFAGTVNAYGAGAFLGVAVSLIDFYACYWDSTNMR